MWFTRVGVCTSTCSLDISSNAPPDPHPPGSQTAPLLAFPISEQHQTPHSKKHRCSLTPFPWPSHASSHHTLLTLCRQVPALLTLHFHTSVLFHATVSSSPAGCLYPGSLLYQACGSHDIVPWKSVQLFLLLQKLLITIKSRIFFFKHFTECFPAKCNANERFSENTSGKLE